MTGPPAPALVSLQVLLELDLIDRIYSGDLLLLRLIFAKILKDLIINANPVIWVAPCLR